ncbi:hypothetical protein CTAYLR_001352 [Chrysophaeum taylorii]|uniref:NADP-dependent oxidoreductase domain-containing protein n=1 Tax=Chrysophaeum taylorii TaxID=2483200 RepID=A0AAD7U581_9STRA|nr:hypothetical protein CTAYLR_001352 [Chrysophaeum taylorii]
MKIVKIGDLEVSEVCAGTMTFGSFNSKEETFAMLDRLVELGVNFFDTAELYPVAFNYGATTELWLGEWLEGQKQGGRIYVATKVNPRGVGSGGGPHAFEADRVLESCRQSLARLKVDRIDLYYLHFPSRMGQEVFGWGSYDADRYRESRTSSGEMAVFEKQVLAIKQLLDSGLVSHWGLSNENAYGVTMFCVTADRLGVPRPVAIQNDLSLNNRVFESDVWEACEYFGIKGIPYGVLAGGVLTGKYVDPDSYAGDRPLDMARHNAYPEFQPRYHRSVPARRAAEEYVSLARDYGMKPLDLALVWARDRPYNEAVIIGTTTVDQVDACVRAVSARPPLPPDLLAKIDRVHEKYRNPQAAYAKKTLLFDDDAELWW